MLTDKLTNEIKKNSTSNPSLAALLSKALSMHLDLMAQVISNGMNNGKLRKHLNTLLTFSF